MSKFTSFFDNVIPNEAKRAVPNEVTKTLSYGAPDTLFKDKWGLGGSKKGSSTSNRFAEETAELKAFSDSIMNQIMAPFSWDRNIPKIKMPTEIAELQRQMLTGIQSPNFQSMLTGDQSPFINRVIEDQRKQFGAYAVPQIRAAFTQGGSFNSGAAGMAQAKARSQLESDILGARSNAFFQERADQLNAVNTLPGLQGTLGYQAELDRVNLGNQLTAWAQKNQNALQALGIETQIFSAITGNELRAEQLQMMQDQIEAAEGAAGGNLLGSILGGIGGFFVGGPVGAMAGSQIGGGIGSYMGGGGAPGTMNQPNQISSAIGGAAMLNFASGGNMFGGYGGGTTSFGRTSPTQTSSYTPGFQQATYTPAWGLGAGDGNWNTSKYAAFPSKYK